MIIALEGIDAAGKQTQSKRLAEVLRVRGLNVAELSFPNYVTETGTLIKKILRQERWLGACEEFADAEGLHHDQALVLQALMTSNRYEAIQMLTLWKAAASKFPDGSTSTGVLVLDRYWASGYAYGTADGVDPTWLLNIHRALPQPDLSVFCDITVEQSFQRRPVREDAYEASRERLEKARCGYRKLVDRDSDNWLVTDPNGTVDSIHAQIMNRVDQLFVTAVVNQHLANRQPLVGC